MSSRDSDPSARPADAEPALQRWSRLKAQARAAERTQAQPDTDLPPAAPPATSGAVPPVEPPRVELPDLDLLDQDSDYSAFLAPGVDLPLRRRALRKLFASPKFNVFDGLDTYRDDYTSFPALGDIVTADMRHHVERLAREALENLQANAADQPLPAIAGPVASAGAPVDPTTTTAAVEHLPNPAVPASMTVAATANPSRDSTDTAATSPPAPAPANTAATAPEQSAAPKENH